MRLQRRVGAYHPIQRELAKAFEGFGLGSRLRLLDPGIPVSLPLDHLDAPVTLGKTLPGAVKPLLPRLEPDARFGCELELRCRQRFDCQILPVAVGSSGGDPLGFVGWFAQDIATPPDGLDVASAITGIGEFFAQLTNENVDDF
jgi:hypothetical protein